ncbi:MAG: hypothetical protein NZ957_03670 [Thaumarchaeota archaeon]|nr:hypothetical protein [Candidatus Calditenuaceae archaeon]MDW8042460.1 hypothetical protein [Nitrososphaerota archaeon]
MSVVEGEEALVVNGCTLIKKALYDPGNESWYVDEDGVLKLGLLPTTQFKWGKITTIIPKPVGTVVEEGRSLAFIEAKKFVGHVTANFKVEIVEVNAELSNTPHLPQSDPYGRGWIARLKPLGGNYLERLKPFNEVAEALLGEIKGRGIVCFKEVPDIVMAAIGVECSQALIVLSDAIKQVPSGQVIHLVAEADEGSEREVRSWSRITGNQILEFIMEGRLAHALIRRR